MAMTTSMSMTPIAMEDPEGMVAGTSVIETHGNGCVKPYMPLASRVCSLSLCLSFLGCVCVINEEMLDSLASKVLFIKTRGDKPSNEHGTRKISQGIFLCEESIVIRVAGTDALSWRRTRVQCARDGRAKRPGMPRACRLLFPARLRLTAVAGIG